MEAGLKKIQMMISKKIFSSLKNCGGCEKTWIMCNCMTV